MKRIKALMTTISESDPKPPTYLAKLFHKPRYDELVRIMQDLVGKVNTLLDAGCGRGTFYEWLSKSRLKVETYVGCDINLRSLKEVKGERVVCDVHFLPFRDRAFDCIVCSEVLEHLEKPLLAFSNILKASDGWVIVTFPDEKIKNALGFKYFEHISEVRSEELINLSKALGYKLVFHKRLYFAFPPSFLDKLMAFSLSKVKLASIVLQVLSRLLLELCLIKTEILVFVRK